MEDPDEQDGEFLWKAGPAPCRLKGRPSLNLIRNGQVRIMSKALLMSCPERGDDDHEAGSRNQVHVLDASVHECTGRWRWFSCITVGKGRRLFAGNILCAAVAFLSITSLPGLLTLEASST